MTLVTWLKIRTNICNFVTASAQNLINSLTYFSVFLLNCKIHHASSTWKELIRKSLYICLFSEHRNCEKKKLIVYMVLGDAVTKYGSLTMFQEL